MDIEQVQMLIGALGFPIVAYLLMFFKMIPAIDGLTKAVNSLEKYMKGDKSNE